MDVRLLSDLISLVFAVVVVCTVVVFVMGMLVSVVLVMRVCVFVDVRLEVENMGRICFIVMMMVMVAVCEYAAREQQNRCTNTNLH